MVCSGPDGRRRPLVAPFARDRLRAPARDRGARDGASGALLGWLLGSAGIGLLVGAVVGIPLCDRRRLRRLLARGLVSARRVRDAAPGARAPRSRARRVGASIALALPVFVAAGWPLARLGARGDALGRRRRLFALLLTRLPLGTGNLAAAGMRGYRHELREHSLIGIPLVAVTVADERRRAVPPRSRSTRSPTRSSSRVSLVDVLRAGGARVTRLLAASRRCSSSRCRRSRSRPTTRGEEEKFNPASEWTLHEWVPIHLGPLDMSINKAVAYLLLGALLTILLGIVLMRVKVGSEPTGGRRSARRSTRSRRCRSPSRACRRRRSAAGSRTSRR